MARRRRARLAPLAAALAVGLPLAGAGCAGGGGEGEAPTTVATAPAPAPAVVVSVVDGDTGAPVAGAAVRGGGAPGGPVDANAGADGAAELPGEVTTVVAVAPGYSRAQEPVEDGRAEMRLHRIALQSPEYGDGPQRLRHLPAIEMEPPAGRDPDWIFDAITLIEFPPVVRNGLAVFGVNSGRVFALETETGEIAWETRQEGPIASSPAFHEDLVLVSSMDGMLTAYDAESGARAWRFPTAGSPIESSPLVVDGLAYVGTWAGVLYAVDARTGEERWRFQAASDIKSSAALIPAGGGAPGRIVVGDYAGNLYALDPATGARVWTYGGGQRFYGGPGVADGIVVVGDVGGAVIALDARTGERRWRHSTGGAYVYSSPAIADGSVFIGSYNGNFQRLSLRTGAVEWTHALGGRISGSATVIDGVVYTSRLYRRGEERRTVGLDIADGGEVFRLEDGRYSPAVAAGRTLFLVGTRLLYAYHADGGDGPTVERAARVGGPA